MAYHYSDMGMTTDIMNEQYIPEYARSYMIQNPDADYEVRSSVLVDGGDRFGVSAVTFDKFEELIWMGNAGGHVTSYYGPQMRKYTSFQVHMTEEIRDIITLDQGLFILSKTQLRHQIRRGLPKHTHTSENMTEMQCLFQPSPTKLLMGGHQDKLIDFDVTKMTESVIPIPEDGCAVLRSGGGSLVACGSANGTVSLRDLRTPVVAEHTFKAHTACLSDLDMQGDLLITSGFAQAGTMAVAEQYVVVWDVRHLKGTGAWTIPVASPPFLLHFLPAISGRALAMASAGHVALLHVNDRSESEKQSVFQVDTQGSFCSVMDVSGTSQAFVFGDQAGHLHLFSSKHNNEPVFNNFSRETEFATPVRLPYANVNDASFRFSSVPLPPLTTGTKWFHELPEEFFKKVFRKPKPIDPEVLKTMKMKGPIGYAPNPGTRRRNEYPYIDDNMEDLHRCRLHDTTANTKPIPKEYQKLEIRYNKNEPNEELENCNRTGLPSIEATLPNSYCNPMIQILYNMPPLKSTLIAHTCAKEFCLTCELGFLFRMLDTSGGAPCQANNFLRAFRTVPEAAALGLILPDRGSDRKVDLVALIQSWNRFILHQIHYELLETRKKEKELAILAQNASPPKPARLRNSLKKQMNGQFEEYQYTELEFLGPSEYEHEYRNGLDEKWKDVNGIDEGSVGKDNLQGSMDKELSNHTNSEREESEISKLFAIARQQLNRCLKCNKEEERESVVLACALQYASSRDGERTGGFLELVRASLCARRSTPAWCERCSRFTPTTQRGRLVRLPPILAINCGGVSAEEKAYWTKGPPKEVADPTKRGGNGKPCRYGLHCSRPGCRFKHPERPSSSSQVNSKSETQDISCIIPLQLHIRLQSDGDIVINDKIESQTDKQEKHKKKPNCTHSEAEYTLTAVVLCIEDNPKNLVAYVRIADKGDANWYLYNDLSIVQVAAEEVSQCGAWWKSPCVLFYTSARLLRAGDARALS
ncbi:PAN2-PAN3 deadenylation complex catalytic subunit PAN2 isoform X1 [Zerene cesonia]|uniref:PAN2-PAN3 deadenylation complex catalytic subunit PAN2 isoform X1 n=1 Tax=Zerene cesonia TaxID=33412 RepID=UPI0018E4F752|nr:PAN2-PAN3 deadenylation complex catalytic subunit PAN2 isoform X1 [Zerene cesonia]